MQHAYITFFEGWEEVFPSGKKVSAHEKRYIELDSMTIDNETEVNRIRGKRAAYTAVCPVCEEKLSFKKRDLNERNPHFFHLSGRKCFSYESLAHGTTKRYIYQLFQQAGYEVREEHRHKRNGRLVRADVAVLRLRNGEEELKLAIEIQASNIRIADIAKRVNVYFEENVPTAWVLILDSFFPTHKTIQDGEEVEVMGYAGTRTSIFNAEESRYEFTYISPTEEHPFFVTGSVNKAFDYLMDLYHVVMAVDHEGHVFLIRRDPTSARLRVQAILEGRQSDSYEGKFLVSRVAEPYIVPLLLETEVLQAEFMGSEMKPKSFEPNIGEFRGTDHRSESEEQRKREDASITFKDPQEIEISLNSVLLARQSRQALQEAFLQAQREAEACKRKEEEEQKQREEEYRRLEEERKRQEEERERIRLELEEIARQQRLENQLKWAQEMEQYKEKRRLERERFEEEQRQEEERKKQEEEMKRLQEEQRWQQNHDILSKDITELGDIPNDIINQVRNDFWNKFLRDTKMESDFEFERRYFPNGLPPWFISKKFKMKDREEKERKRRELAKKKERRKELATQKEKETKKDSDWEQFTLF